MGNPLWDLSNDWDPSGQNHRGVPLAERGGREEEFPIQGGTPEYLWPPQVGPLLFVVIGSSNRGEERNNL